MVIGEQSNFSPPLPTCVQEEDGSITLYDPSVLDRLAMMLLPEEQQGVKILTLGRVGYQVVSFLRKLSPQRLRRTMVMVMDCDESWQRIARAWNERQRIGQTFAMQEWYVKRITHDMEGASLAAQVSWQFGVPAFYLDNSGTLPELERDCGRVVDFILASTRKIFPSVALQRRWDAPARRPVPPLLQREKQVYVCSAESRFRPAGKPALVIVLGQPGSGKTSLAKFLEQRWGGGVVRADDRPEIVNYLSADQARCSAYLQWALEGLKEEKQADLRYEAAVLMTDYALQLYDIQLEKERIDTQVRCLGVREEAWFLRELEDQQKYIREEMESFRVHWNQRRESAGARDQLMGLPLLPKGRVESREEFTSFHLKPFEVGFRKACERLYSQAERSQASIAILEAGRASWHALRTLDYLPEELREVAVVVFIEASGELRQHNIAAASQQRHKLGMELAGYLLYGRYDSMPFTPQACDYTAAHHRIPAVLFQQEDEPSSSLFDEGCEETFTALMALGFTVSQQWY